MNIWIPDARVAHSFARGIESSVSFLRATVDASPGSQGFGLYLTENTAPTPTVTLTVHGWNRIAELERAKMWKDSRQAFVAMWFDSSLKKAYSEGYATAIFSIDNIAIFI